MLIPGFTVRELPVKLTSLNNVEYAPDGRLFAGGYDGRFHLLRDTDGDGLVTPTDRPEPNRKRSDGARPGNQPPPEPFNRKLDLDGDGALSFEEFRAGIQVRNLSEDEQEDRFESIDRNGDQKISPQDFPPPPPPPKAE